MFFQLLGSFSQKHMFLRIQYFFLFGTQPVNSIFSVVVQICKIHVISEAYIFPLCNHSCEKWESVLAMALVSNEESSFNASTEAAYQSKLSLNNRAKIEK